MGYMRSAILGVLIVGLAACSGEQAGITAPNDGAVSIAPADNPAGVSANVTGSAMVQVFAINGLGLRKLTFNAQILNDGSVSGEWNIVAGASILHGDIDCLTILPDGRSARLSGIVTDAKFTSFIEGTAFALEVVDNGEGNSMPADVTTDLRSFRNMPVEIGRAFCETGEAPDGLEAMPIIKGNVQVHAN